MEVDQAAAVGVLAEDAARDEAARDEMLRQVFQTFDRNRNGRIEVQEMEVMSEPIYVRGPSMSCESLPYCHWRASWKVVCLLHTIQVGVTKKCVINSGCPCGEGCAKRAGAAGLQELHARAAAPVRRRQ
jgi:hypothetical protein